MKRFGRHVRGSGPKYLEEQKTADLLSCTNVSGGMRYSLSDTVRGTGEDQMYFGFSGTALKRRRVSYCDCWYQRGGCLE